MGESIVDGAHDNDEQANLSNRDGEPEGSEREEDRSTAIGCGCIGPEGPQIGGMDSLELDLSSLEVERTVETECHDDTKVVTADDHMLMLILVLYLAYMSGPVQINPSLLTMPGGEDTVQHDSEVNPEAKPSDHHHDLRGSSFREGSANRNFIHSFVMNHFDVWDKWSGLWTDAMLNVMCGEDDPELCPFGQEEQRKAGKFPVGAKKVGGKRMRLRRGITLDSGAADNVIPRRMIRKWMRIRQSPGSRRNVHDVAANSSGIKNGGEVDFQFMSENNEMQSWVFQVAEVNKALCAVSYMVDHDDRIIFDRDKKTGADTSHMIHKPSGKTIKLRRERNVWTIDATIVDNDGGPDIAGDFARQG